MLRSEGLRITTLVGAAALLAVLMALLVLVVGGKASAASQVPDPRFAPPKNYDNPGKGRPIDIARGDFNEDGVADLVLAVTNISTKNVSLFKGKQDGTFKEPPEQFDAGPSPNAILTSDFNGDGHLDLALADGGKAPSFSGSVAILLGTGDGAFKKLQSFPSGGSFPTGLAAPDVDRDGDKDLVVVNSSSNNLTVLLNNGKGTFKSGQSIATAEGPNYLAQGDFDGDRDPDLVVTIAGRNTVAFYENKGGRYVLGTSVAVGPDPQGIIVGFFNRGDKLDFATANADSSTVSVRLGNGNGTFKKAGDFPSGPGQPTALATADFNGDGKKDLAVTNMPIGPSNVGVLTGRGDGTFKKPKTFKAGNSPAGIVQGKFNRDGKPDLAVANEFSRNLSVLINTTSRSAKGVKGDGIGTGAGKKRCGVKATAGNKGATACVGGVKANAQR